MIQGSLFDITQDGSAAFVGLAGVMPAIRARMNVVAKNYEKGRDHLVDAINEVAQRENIALTRGGGKTITSEQLSKWLQPAATGHEPNFAAILCFCTATGDTSPMQPAMRVLGLVAVSPQDAKYLEYGKICAELNETAAESRKKRERKKMLEAEL